MKILLVGGESAGAEAFKAIGRTSDHLVAVLASTGGRGATAAGKLIALAEKAGVPVWPAEQVKEFAFAQRVRDVGIDLILNVHSLFLFHPQVVAAPTVGSFNLHPGPLPRFAGLNVPSWAIYSGETSHGVTLHWMSSSIDAGPIAFSSAFDIAPEDTALKVSIECVRRGIPLIEKLLAAARSGEVPRIPQDLEGRRYFRAGPPDGGRVSWAWPARKVVDLVRACDYRPFPSPWGRALTTVGGRSVGIVSARRTGRVTAEPPGTVGRTVEAAVEVACSDEWVFVDDVEQDGQTLRAVDAFRGAGVLGSGPEPLSGAARPG